MEKLFNDGLQKLLSAKKNQLVLHSFFEYQELKKQIRETMRAEGLDPDAKENAGKLLIRCVSEMKLTIPVGSIIAGTQDDAFSPSYALINPAFTVESFAGYCDPVAIYNDVETDENIGHLADYIAFNIQAPYDDKQYAIITVKANMSEN